MLAALLERLRAALPAERWAGAEIAEDIDVLAARAGQVETGTAILMPWRERAGEQGLASGGHRQRVETQFAVGVVVRDYDQLMGETRALQFDTLKADVEAALAGWVPPGATEPCELVGGETSPIARGVSIYVTTWATARYLAGETA